MRTLESFPSQQADALVLYDAECELCRRSVAWLTARDPHHVLEFRPLQDTALLRRHGIDPDAATASLHVVEFRPDGERLRIGADGMLWAVSRLPGYGWVRLLLWIPPIRWVARRIYRKIAGERKRDGDCACSVG